MMYPKPSKANASNILSNSKKKFLQKSTLAAVGDTVPVLVEGESRRDADKYHGKTDGFKTAVFPKADSKIGEIVNVRVDRTTAHTLIGQIV